MPFRTVLFGTIICEEDTGLRPEDGAERIFISAKGDKDDVSDNMRSFLAYLTDQSTKSDLTRKLEEAVRKAKARREWSVEYMTLYEMKQMEREEGKAEGKIDELISLVYDKVLSEDVAADRAEKRYGIDRDRFRAMVSQYRPEDEDNREG